MSKYITNWSPVLVLLQASLGLQLAQCHLPRPGSVVRQHMGGEGDFEEGWTDDGSQGLVGGLAAAGEGTKADRSLRRVRVT
jgi:hypothetical protein